MTLSGGPCASRDGVTSVVVDFDAVEDMNASGPARKGRKADAGLAIKKHRSVAGGNRERLRRAYLAEPKKLLFSN